MRTNWQRVRDIFERVLEEQPADVDAWLAREAADSCWPTTMRSKLGA